MPHDFATIEPKWQRYWLDHKTFRALDPADAGDRPKAYLLDMFPYPSGAGLHVGHPEGYTATDILARHLRMRGYNVLHPMGWDAFGLPAEQHAIKTGEHPAETTKKNVDTFRRQIQSLGLGYDWDREVNTTDPAYYRWTQWIFLQLFNSYFDPFVRKARPIGHLIAELQNTNLVVAPDYSVTINPQTEGLEVVAGGPNLFRYFHELDADEQRAVVDGQRLAYTADAPVNWCPALGTTLANEEVVDGKSEVGGFPVERRPMRQWMLRITQYADRLIGDLDALQWPESIKEMQRNWIGRSEGAEVDFELQPNAWDAAAAEGEDAGGEDPITVFTTRPDTLFGATYLVLAPEHGLVRQITAPQRRAEVEAYVAQARNRSDRERVADAKEKTGVFTGAHAVNPANGQPVPIWIADYVLTGYGTGAIMAVPAHDDRDFAFAQKFGLPIVHVVQPGSGDAPKDFAFTGEGVAENSDFLNGLRTPDAKAKMIGWLEDKSLGRRRVNYKLRDWLFSRQRYWGEPFPIALDADGNARAIDESALPVELPPMQDFKPTGTPEGPLSKAGAWLDAGDGMRRETNTMPQWAGSCWYYLRYLDPTNAERFVDPAKEAYWMPVDLYVGGVEHATLHLLYARFWHKVLHDLGHVATSEPFHKLVNQGLILGETEYHFAEVAGKAEPITDYDVKEEPTDAGPKLVGTHRQTGARVVLTRVEELLVEKKGDRFVLRAQPTVPVDARSFKMSKSRGNVVNPDGIVEDYGADAFRLYEMYMGPLEAQKPWATRDIVGMSRFLSSVARKLLGDEEHARAVSDDAPSDALARLVARTTKKVGEDIVALRYNVAIAELIKLNNELNALPAVPRSVASTFARLLAPFAPHLAEEAWEKLGEASPVAHAAWPGYDDALLTETTIEVPVQVNGKLRDRLTLPADASELNVLEAAAASERVRPWLEGKQVKKKVYVPGRMVNFVVA